jgi:hypothetical protein
MTDQQQQQTSINIEQVRGAAAAGLRLLDDKDMKVPMDIAINGSLGVLRMLLLGVANGQLVFTTPPSQDKQPAHPPQDKQLRSVDGNAS